MKPTITPMDHADLVLKQAIAANMGIEQAKSFVGHLLSNLGYAVAGTEAEESLTHEERKFLHGYIEQAESALAAARAEVERLRTFLNDWCYAYCPESTGGYPFRAITPQEINPEVK